MNLLSKLCFPSLRSLDAMAYCENVGVEGHVRAQVVGGPKLSCVVFEISNFRLCVFVLSFCDGCVASCVFEWRESSLN